MYNTLASLLESSRVKCPNGQYMDSTGVCQTDDPSKDPLCPDGYILSDDGYCHAPTALSLSEMEQLRGLSLSQEDNSIIHGIKNKYFYIGCGSLALILLITAILFMKYDKKEIAI